MIVSPEGVIISVNRGFEMITGYTAEEVLGKPCGVLKCSACAMARQTKGCHYCAMFLQGELKKQRCIITRKDGRPVHVFKNASIFKDSAGHVIGAVETLTDISDLMNKEAQIETYRRELNAEDRFHGMIGQSPVMQKVFELISNASQSEIT